jgi:hypothetical protein
MKANEGSTDRTVRIVVGLALLVGVIFIEGPLRWIGLVGLVPLATGVLGYCPLYGLFGFDTCPIEKKSS